MPIATPIRAAVTGGSGYIGRSLIERLQDDSGIEHILSIDRQPPAGPLPGKCTFLRADIGDRRIAEALRAQQVNGLLHLAFIVNPLHDEAEMRRINVGGSAGLLQACDECGIRNIVIASSGAAYCAKPGRPEFLSEDHPLEESSLFSYADHKLKVERLCRAYQDAHAEAVLKVVRPCIVIGPHVENYLSRFLRKRFVFCGLGHDPPMQFIHEEDTAGVFHAVLKSEARGAFNACADGTVHFSELVGLLKRDPIPLPVPLLKAVTALGWKARLTWISEAPPSLVDYLVYPWLMNNARVKKELGYSFLYTSRDAVRDFLENHPSVKHVMRTG